MKSELRRAWDGGIQELWVDNIGGLKPLEIEMEFFLRSAWEAGKETTTADIPAFTAGWIDAKFSGGHGAKAGDIYAQYYQLNNQRKIEHLTADVFPQVGYGDEAGRRLAAIQGLYDQTNDILAALPADERDSFFELFGVKIHLAYLTNAEFYYADRSTLAARQGKAAAADRYLEVSRAFARSTRALIHYYNRQMAGGRWDGMFTPHEFPPPVMPLFPSATPALKLGEPGLGVTAWGAENAARSSELRFSVNGVDTKWIEVFNTGAGSVSYTVDADTWIQIGPFAGAVAMEQRIPVRIADLPGHAGRTGTIRVTNTDTGDAWEVAVHVAAASKAAAFQCASEADGYVSIDPAAPDRTEPGGFTRWAAVPHLGRYGNAATQLQPLGAHLPGVDSAVLEYAIQLATPGTHLLELHRLPTLDSTGRIRVGISVDDRPVIVESSTTDEHRGSWTTAIQDNVEKLQLLLPWLDAGPHMVRLHGVDEYFTLSKIVVLTGKPVDSNLGPDFSTHARHLSNVDPDPDPSVIDPEEIDHAAVQLYGIDPNALPLPDQAYADRHFWEGATTFRIPHTVPQTGHGSRNDYSSPEGRKDVVARLGSGVVVETGGVIAFEAENALANTEYAWTTEVGEDSSSTWTHTQAETGAGTGLAMHVRPRGLRWDDPATAPAMHFAMKVKQPGPYRVWLLVKFDDNQNDSCAIAVDEVVQPLSEQFSAGEMCAYGLRQRWIWVHLSDIALAEGDRTFSIIARKSGLRVDRAYLTLGDELPPTDAKWAPSTLLATSKPSI